MKTKKTAGIAAGVVIAGVIIVVAVFAASHHLLAGGDYYVKVDNSRMAENDSGGGVVNFKSSEPYIYTLPACNDSGETFDVEFGTSRELRQDAYLKLQMEPLRGVVNWEEVEQEELPQKAAEQLG